ncbi:acetyl-CoA carboxylase, biotin carboxyl carrier protein [Enterococcus faecium]|nr:acetyl-CoA carboxylase, biotin carboxyl carrier protein [Enterococcus faecium]
MDINEIRELVSQFDQSSLTEFDLREGQFELYMNKNKTSRGMNMVQTNETLPVSEPVNVISEQATTAPEIMKEKESAVFDGIEVVSPIVQYLMESRLFRQSWESFICNQVAKGEVICIIEAMKLMNEITSEADGVITEILVENESVVEYGQPLFRIQQK